MRITWTLPSCTILALFFGGLAHQAEGGWFDGASSSNTANPQPGTNLGRPAAKKEPSTWDKISSGPKKFFGGIGNALSPGKKPATTTTAVNPYAAAMKPQPQKKSWFAQTFGPKEPEKPRSPAEWMSQTKRPDF